MKNVASVRKRVVADILERYHRHGWTEPIGEWGEINLRSRAPLKEFLECGDVDGTEALLAGMFDSPLAQGLVTMAPGADPVEHMAHSLKLWRSYTDETDFGVLHAPAATAWTVNVDGHPILMDTPRHDRYAQLLGRLVPGGSVLEIGGGYGGFALQAVRRGLSVEIVDIPETLYVAYYWLTMAGVDVGWERDAEVVLWPSAERLKSRKIDAVLAAHSLSEIDRASVVRYLDLIEQLRPRYFFHDSSHQLPEWREVGSATFNLWPEVQAQEMVMGAPWREVYRAPTLWYGSARRYWEFLYER